MCLMQYICFYLVQIRLVWFTQKCACVVLEWIFIFCVFSIVYLLTTYLSTTYLFFQLNTSMLKLYLLFVSTAAVQLRNGEDRIGYPQSKPIITANQSGFVPTEKSLESEQEVWEDCIDSIQELGWDYTPARSISFHLIMPLIFLVEAPFVLSKFIREGGLVGAFIFALRGAALLELVPRLLWNHLTHWFA